MSSISEALGKISSQMEILAEKAKRIKYTPPVENEPRGITVTEFIESLKKAERISRVAKTG